jgi:hypothetical protein
MSYEINPCSAAMMKYKHGYCDINSVNDTCYQICKNAGISDEEAYNSCSKCQIPFQKAKFECSLKTPCSFSVKEPPVWNQVPSHFFPLFKSNGNDKEKALVECKLKCYSDPTTPQECMIQCQTDADSVIPLSEGYINQVNESQSPTKFSMRGVFYVILVILVIVILIIIKYA